MAEPSTHINYSFEDIQRYLKGNMSATEMHIIEKAALQDPFLADAIEGYNNISIETATQHLNEINTSLFSESKKTEVVAFTSKTKWLRIAALIIIMAGVGIAGTLIFKNAGKQQQIAEVKKELPNLSHNNSGMSKSDTSSSVNRETTAIIKNKKKEEPLTTSKRKVSISAAKNLAPDESNSTAGLSAVPIQQNEDEFKSLAAAPSYNKEIDSMQEISARKKMATDSSIKTFAGKILDENGDPVAGAVVESADKKLVVTDMSGHFVVTKNDSILNVIASTIGYERTKAALQPGNENLIILSQTNTTLNEAVITTLGTSKTKKINDKPTPVGGWQNFNNYVVSELNKDSAKKNYTFEKDLVELEFLIDNSGNPYNITITKPLDDKRNSKAIEILKTGPKWTNTPKNKKAKVAISF